MIPNHLRIQPGQEALTPAQEAEAEHFAQERIEAQLSTEPVDEAEAVALLKQAYAVSGLPPPGHIRWLDGPLELLAGSALPSPSESLIDNMDRVGGVWNILPTSVKVTIEHPWHRLSLWQDSLARIRASVGDGLWDRIKASVAERVATSVWDRVGESIQAYVQAWIEAGLWASLPTHLQGPMRAALRYNVYDRIIDALWAPTDESTRAYENVYILACPSFLDAYLAPNALHALAQFNERVSGYWLGQKGAILVRRPKVLARDAEGRLHRARGKCIEYHDGWGFYAWHGVRVPEQVILSPETLTREEYFQAQNVGVRRVMQERMGERFMSELGGVVLDSSPRGTLYEVRLPKDDPERVARYVHVQDASSERQYFVRVPPTIQTVAEAVAWSFGLSAEEYRPVQET